MNNIKESKELLEEYREQISKIDNDIIELLNKRGSIIQKIGNLKIKLGMEINQPEREKEIINRIKKKSIILKPTSIESIWREIFIASKLIQNPLNNST